MRPVLLLTWQLQYCALGEVHSNLDLYRGIAFDSDGANLEDDLVTLPKGYVSYLKDQRATRLLHRQPIRL